MRGDDSALRLHPHTEEEHFAQSTKSLAQSTKSRLKLSCVRESNHTAEIHLPPGFSITAVERLCAAVMTDRTPLALFNSFRDEEMERWGVGEMKK